MLNAAVISPQPMTRIAMQREAVERPEHGVRVVHGTGDEEDVVAFWIRHTFRRPRDIVFIGRDLAAIDPARPDNLHVQLICRVTAATGEQGIGTFEQLAIGPYDPLGLQGLAEPA